MNIFTEQLSSLRVNFLKNILLIAINFCLFFGRLMSCAWLTVRAEMKQFDSFSTAFRLRFFSERVYTQSKLSGFTTQATLIKAHGRRSIHSALQLNGINMTSSSQLASGTHSPPQSFPRQPPPGTVWR
ncbi:MAG TPA: hypothetical protein VGC21_22130 [Telluria sp.]|jgi:hypothetical protein